MDLFLDKKRVRVTDADLLGEGGEARVYRYKELALKVFHTLDAPKLEKLKRFPRGLPAAVISPQALVFDGKDRVAGYAMRAVPAADELARLSQRRWREGVVSNGQVQGLFESLAAVVAQLHRCGVVIGDFNDGNVLFRGTQPYLIDADSMQFSGLPCTVGHERFLDPRLYGVDLAATARFDAGTDWYAWSVLLFSSLLYVHPFGGIHKTLPTPLRRAAARHSVLRGDVVYPRHGVHFRVLPDDVLGWFERVFEKDERGAPGTLQMSWTRCSCGLEHARAVCPHCQTLGPAAARQALRSSGRCSARTVFSTSGRILGAAMRGGLRYLYEENGAVRREDGTVVPLPERGLGTRFFIGGASTWIADSRGTVTRVDSGRIGERTSTGVRGTSPVFAASSSAAYRTEAEWLIDEVTGSRIGQVLEGQTWIWTGERLGFGFYRAGGFTFGFLMQPGRAGLREVKLPHLKGRLVDAEAVFDDAHVLFSCVLELDGKETTSLWLFGSDGALRAEARGPTAERMFAGVRGRALLHGRVVAATAEGLLSLKVDGGRFVEGTLFTDTEPFVSAGDELYPQSDGSLFVVGPREVVQLTLS